jgi:hypothetical protein
LGNFKIMNLATSNCVKDWDKVALQQGLGKETPGRVRAGNYKLVR